MDFLCDLQETAGLNIISHCIHRYSLHEYSYRVTFRIPHFLRVRGRPQVSVSTDFSPFAVIMKPGSNEMQNVTL